MCVAMVFMVFHVNKKRVGLNSTGNWQMANGKNTFFFHILEQEVGMIWLDASLHHCRAENSRGQLNFDL